MQNRSNSNSNNSDNFSAIYEAVGIFENVIAWIIFCFGLPAIFLAIYALYHLIKAGHIAPIYIINLLISDLVQVVVRIVFIVLRLEHLSPAYIVALVIVRSGIIASLGFMVCISLERYLVVVYPLWYRYYRTIKHSILASLAVWLLTAIYAAMDYSLLKDFFKLILVLSILFLLPLPILVFLYIGSRRALAATISVPGAEKKRIMGLLTLVLGIYALFFLPFTFVSFYVVITQRRTVTIIWVMAVVRNVVRLSPLVDPFLYIFMRKDAKGTVETFPCCRKLIASGNSWSRSNTEPEDTKTSTTASNNIITSNI